MKTKGDIKARNLYSDGFNYAIDTGSPDHYAIVANIVGYVTGTFLLFKASSTNTGASDITVGGLATVSIKKNVDEDLAAGDIQQDQMIGIVYDGTNFQMFSGAGGGGTSGYSGYSGYSGVKGDNPGSSGYSGYSGYSGQDGTIGIDGVSGYSGYSGVKGDNPGSSGYSGYSGYSGQDGTIGIDGVSGYSGFSGYSGYSGYSGAMDTTALHKDQTILETTIGTFQFPDVRIVNNGVVNRNVITGLINSIELTGYRTLTITRNATGYVTNIADGTKTWTYTRDTNNNIVSWTVT